MTEISTTTERQPRSVLVDMSIRYGMEPQAFEATVRATCMKADKSGKVPSREEFAAFLLVAKEYNLNPLLKEIYAFPAKGGGIVPIVSVDGWVNLINSQTALDGIEFDTNHDEKGALVSITCRIYRKDRSRPVEVTEYLAECIRNTEPWAMKHRMLRHKSLIQCARYAFGFAGIYDEDEGEKIAGMRDITPPAPPKPPAPPSAAKQPEKAEPVIDHVAESIDADQPEDAVTIDGEVLDGDGGEEFDVTKFFEDMETSMACAADEDAIQEIWNDADVFARFESDPNGDTNVAIANAIRNRALKRVRQVKSNG